MGSSILTIKKKFFKVHRILKVSVRKGVITMNDSDGSHSCREKKQKAAHSPTLPFVIVGMITDVLSLPAGDISIIKF